MPSPPQMPFAMDAPPFVPMNGPDGWTSPGGSYSELAPVGGLALGFGESCYSLRLVTALCLPVG